MRMTINIKNIRKYAGKYDEQYRGKDDEKTEKEMKTLLRKQRFLTRENLIKIGNWKSRRPRRHYESEENDDLTVKEITKFSFKTKSEKARIKSLLALKGVDWPVASTILHFPFPEKYPIMDFRVIRSLYGKEPSTYTYNFGFWNDYCNRLRNIAKKYNLCIRMVEKALWKYDELKFGKKKTCK